MKLEMIKSLVKLLRLARLGLLHLVFSSVFLIIAQQGRGQIWQGPDQGYWGDLGNWNGSIPGKDPDSPSFVRGALAFINSPFMGGAQTSTILLDDKHFSIGVLIIDGNQVVRLESQTPSTLVLDRPLDPLLYVRGAGLDIGHNVNIALTDNNGSPIPLFLEEGSKLTMNGRFIGPGGIELKGPGTVILNALNDYNGETLIDAGFLEVTENGGITNDVRIAANGALKNSGKIAGSVTVNGGQLESRGGEITGALINNGGAIRLSGGHYNGGIFSNAGTLTLAGEITTSNVGIKPTLSAKQIIAEPGAAVDLRGDGVIGRSMTVQAQLVGILLIRMANGTLLGLDGAETPIVDWTGDLVGDSTALVLDFNLPPDALMVQGVQVPVLNINRANVAKVRATGLPDNSGLISAFLRHDGKSDTFSIVTVTNPAIGGLIGTLGAVDRLINFTMETPIASRSNWPQAISECNRGTWVSQVGGHSKVISTTASLIDGGFQLRLPSEVALSYRGLQGGLNLGCVSSPLGWDVAAGAIFGFNHGNSSQNLFKFTVNPLDGSATARLEPGNMQSMTNSVFRQGYGGGYLVATRADLSAEIKFMRNRTDYTFSSYGVNGASLPLKNAPMISDGKTVSAKVSRQFHLGNGVSLVPNVGFNLSWKSATRLDFVDGDNMTVGSLTTDRHISRIAVIGAGLQQSTISHDGRGAHHIFGAINFYGDVSQARRAQFQQFPKGAPVDLVTDTLGHFSEISLGLESHRQFKPGQMIERLDLSLRGDIRMSQKMSSLSVKAAIRLQF
jgi:fibronectin-binding autotransporter adhesin